MSDALSMAFFYYPMLRRGGHAVREGTLAEATRYPAIYDAQAKKIYAMRDAVAWVARRWRKLEQHDRRQGGKGGYYAE
jgi:hypothetical protein